MRSHDPHATLATRSTRAPRPPRGRLSAVAAAAALSLGLGACSVSYPIYGSDDIKTGSVDASRAAVTPAPKDAVASSPLAPPPGASAAAPAAQARPVAYAPASKKDDDPAITPSDWAYARGALSLAMGADAVNASVPWANPDTGAYGSFSASAGATTENGATCRSFAASHSGGGHEQRLEGTACRTAAGYWEAVALKTTASRTL
ncbi:RT0821/Lpp0805 family surface protein [Chenggangzhangella methanolivorans]|uniref:RT0821/Lpp0805 family surface protein n=1 Tax=Chenggangzhangella methanolivorans TaxID=1437009 RepID=UPI0036223B6E